MKQEEKINKKCWKLVNGRLNEREKRKKIETREHVEN